MVETFSVNNLNELSTVSRSGTLTVAGTATESASVAGSPGVTSVTVTGTGLSSGEANLCWLETLTEAWHPGPCCAGRKIRGQFERRWRENTPMRGWQGRASLLRLQH